MCLLLDDYILITFQRHVLSLHNSLTKFLVLQKNKGKTIREISYSYRLLFWASKNKEVIILQGLKQKFITESENRTEKKQSNK